MRVDLFELPDAAMFAHELSLSVLANRPVLRRAITAAGGVPGKMIDALSAAATLRARRDLGEDVEITLSPSRADADPHAALRAAFALPQRIGEADDRRVVVFFDEFQELASGRFGDPDIVAKQLRAQLQRARSVSTLFAGSVEHVMRDLLAPSERALSQFGSQYTLGPIVREEWHEGLSARFARARMTSARTALDRLIDAAEGQPRTTMLLAQQSHAELIDLAENRLDDAIVVRGIERAMRADRLRHVQLLGTDQSARTLRPPRRATHRPRRKPLARNPP